MGAAAGWGALIGAGVGIMGNEQQTKDAQRQNAVTIASTRAAPLLSFQTGQHIDPGQTVQAPSQFDSALQGGLMGAKAGADFGEYRDNKAAKAKQSAYDDEMNKIKLDKARRDAYGPPPSDSNVNPNLFQQYDSQGMPIGR